MLVAATLFKSAPIGEIITMSTGRIILNMRGAFQRTPLPARCALLKKTDYHCGPAPALRGCQLAWWTSSSSASSATQSSAFTNLMRCNRHRLLVPDVLTWSVLRLYSPKGKSKGGKDQKGSKNVSVSSEDLEGILNVDKFQSDLDHHVADLKDKFIHQLTLRTSQGVYDRLLVKTPDGNFPLIQLGQVLQKSPKLIEINLAANAHYISHVRQALLSSGLNINPQQDKNSLFIPLPGVTKEHREALAKNAKVLSETSKKHLRDVYSKYHKKISAAKEGHSADALVAADNLAKEMMHKTVQQVEDMTSAKQKELLGGK